MRAWIAGIATAAQLERGDDAVVAVSELAANAVQHSQSGQPGGTFSVAVLFDQAGMTIHVRDLGPIGRNAPGSARSWPPGDAEHGRGLLIVRALTEASSTEAAGQCPAGAAADGTCTWCRIAGPGQLAPTG